MAFGKSRRTFIDWGGISFPFFSLSHPLSIESVCECHPWQRLIAWSCFGGVMLMCRHASKQTQLTSVDTDRVVFCDVFTSLPPAHLTPLILCLVHICIALADAETRVRICSHCRDSHPWCVSSPLSWFDSLLFLRKLSWEDKKKKKNSDATLPKATCFIQQCCTCSFLGLFCL